MFLHSKLVELVPGEVNNFIVGGVPIKIKIPKLN